MSNQKTVKIDPASLKIGTKKEKTNKIRLKPQVSSETNKNINKVKLELLKKVKDYHKDKEVEKLKEDKKHEKNLEKHEIKADFETEFNKSLNFLRDLSNKNREKKKKKKLTNKISNNIEVDVNLSNELNFEPNYGCLKNGSKPTYRELNKTYKNLDKEKNHIQFNNMLTDNLVSNNNEKLLLNNTSNNNEKLVFNNTSNNTSNNNEKLVHNNSSNNGSNNDEKLVSNNSSNNDENILANNNLNNILFNELTNDSNNNLNLNLNYDKNLLADNEIKEDCNLYEEYTNINKELKENNNNTKNKNIPKINRITRKFKYNIGKLKNKNQVGIIIKNRYTLKQIKDDISSKINKPIQDIKNELRKLNLIKLGTEAPNDVLRQIYENAILCGDIKNTNYSNFIHNYDNDENNF